VLICGKPLLVQTILPFRWLRKDGTHGNRGTTPASSTMYHFLDVNKY